MKALIHQFLLAIALATAFLSLSGSFQAVRAEDEPIVISIPVYRRFVQNNLVLQAEVLVSDAITRQFQQNANLSSVQVHVVGDRNGEIIPILTATVSRAQWQENPQVSAWMQYYSPSYALLQRHEQPQTVAIAPVGSTAISSEIPQIERAILDNLSDSRRLTGELAQEYLSDLD